MANLTPIAEKAMLGDHIALTDLTAVFTCVVHHDLIASQSILNIILHNLRPEIQISIPNLSEHSERAEQEKQHTLVTVFHCLACIGDSINAPFGI